MSDYTQKRIFLAGPNTPRDGVAQEAKYKNYTHLWHHGRLFAVGEWPCKTQNKSSPCGLISHTCGAPVLQEVYDSAREQLKYLVPLPDAEGITLISDVEKRRRLICNREVPRLFIQPLQVPMTYAPGEWVPVPTAHASGVHLSCDSSALEKNLVDKTTKPETFDTLARKLKAAIRADVAAAARVMEASVAHTKACDIASEKRMARLALEKQICSVTTA